jgi:hypothetical protein
MTTNKQVASATLNDATDQQLLDALRARGYTLSAWSVEDLAFLDHTEWLAGLSQAQLVAVKQTAMESISRSLEDILGQRGNEHLADWCSLNQAPLLTVASSCLLAAPADPSAGLANASLPPPLQKVSPEEFARTHQCDENWVRMMVAGRHQAIVLTPGQRGTTSNFECTVIGHFRNGMYDVRVPGGQICISALEFFPS